MKNIPFMESSTLPSQLNTSINSGVASQLQLGLQKEPQYNGITIEDMRGNPIFDRRVAEIDKIGLAQKKLAETGNILSKSKFVRQLNKQMQHPAKPKS